MLDLQLRRELATLGAMRLDGDHVVHLTSWDDQSCSRPEHSCGAHIIPTHAVEDHTRQNNYSFFPFRIIEATAAETQITAEPLDSITTTLQDM
jgi:hypothetical protein